MRGFFGISSLETSHGLAIMILNWNSNLQNTITHLHHETKKFEQRESDSKSDAHSFLGLERSRALWVSPQRLHDEFRALYPDTEDSTMMIKTCSILSPHIFPLTWQHTSAATIAAIKRLCFHIILHSPYSPDSASSN